MAKQKYYVVWKGKKTGIFTSWEECSAQVSGFNGAEYKSFEDRRQAEEAFRGAFEDYKGKRTTTLSPEALAIIGDPIADSYCVDAACTGNPGPMEYRCVHTTTRKQLFHQGPFENGSNNIGEFLAIVHALALFQQRAIQVPIYSDSDTALGWVKKKRCKTKLPKGTENTPIFDLIARAEKWLAENEINNKLLKWDTNAWGEIPADFGRK
ncbi:ribonuclease H1 domain-containing protein [Pelolinea submarina]|uniref:Ribonuclease H n=1 Tax=Pelolinea submarina TaxID=913107 RepID=A0A347ZRR9_9CHLR|nr:ribonuclease H family protein [Pelolinea submarina]REG11446.1 ribonuclease HI [Pelolinea submarina]BBB48000.1 ribonuclease HI [Pelolinea submarina]